MVAASIKGKLPQILSFPDKLRPDYRWKLTYFLYAGIYYKGKGREFVDEVDLFNFIP